MSDMVDVINRLEAWVRNYGHEKQPAFIADLRALIGAAKAAQRAAEMLENAEEVTVTYDEEGDTALMVCAFVVDHAVAILKGECEP